MSKIPKILFFIMLFTPAFSQNFEGLDTLVFVNYSGKSFNGANLDIFIAVIYNKLFSKILNIKRPQDYIDVIITKIDNKKADNYLIQYNPGPSVDPMYYIFRIEKKDTVKIGGISGDEIIIPGDGSIYVSARTSRMFKMRQKYIIADGKIVEVKQPFYYVGIKSVTVKNITLFSDTLLHEPLTNLPKGSKITVLLNINNYYFVATPHGLTGWLCIPYNDDGTIIHDVFTAGD